MTSLQLPTASTEQHNEDAPASTVAIGSVKNPAAVYMAPKRGAKGKSLRCDLVVLSLSLSASFFHSVSIYPTMCQESKKKNDSQSGCSYMTEIDV